MAEKILRQYNNATNIKENPSVIVIMNESFSDLSVLGNFESDEYLLNFNNIDSYVMRGHVYSSVYGGGTANSEFEFLTGNSMANIGLGIYPYPNYDLSNTFNMVDLFRAQGYETIAFHPYNPKNWNRINVYNNFGFQSYFSINDMTDMNYISWAVSDQSNYSKLKEIYENRTAPLFLFNVTMQNHGGYDVPLRDDIDLVSIEKQYNSYSDVINYLTLIRESDKAFADLIEYFSEQPDPVIICMFGDHQPSLDEKFLTSINGDTNNSDVEIIEQRYITPYIIWSNYELDVKNQNLDMSLNYLGANLLNIIGFHTDYTEYLLDLERKIPIINGVGYMTTDRIWHNLELQNENINDYKVLQYYEMFGRQ